MEQTYIKAVLKKILYPYDAAQVKDSFAMLLCVDEETGEALTFKMNNGSVRKGYEYHITYHVINDPKYGETNVIDNIIEYDDLDSAIGVEKFIAKLTSASIAKRIVKKFGDKIIGILNGDADEAVGSLKTIHGVGKIRAKTIVGKYNDKKDILAASLSLGKFGFTDNQIKLIKGFYGDLARAAQDIGKNIYKVTYIDGIRFNDIDKKAIELGYTYNDARRMIAGIRYCFITALEYHGWSYMNREQINQVIRECRLENFIQYAQAAVDFMVEKNCINITGTKRVYSLSKLYNIEADIVKELYRIANGVVKPIKPSVLQQHLDNLTTYNEDQLDFVKKAANSALSVLTGAAGTGKTYSVQGVISMFPPSKCYGCALSGRAATNLKERLGEVECSTIHRAIPELAGNPIDNEIFENAKVVVVDESTMIDGEVFLTLLKHIKTGTRLILMGDIKQLPPIGKCQIFHDVLLSGQFTYSNLTKPCRQDAESGIIAYSLNVTEGEYNKRAATLNTFSDISEAEYNLQDMEKYFFNELEHYNSLLEVQICMAMRKECQEINTLVHNRLKEMNVLKGQEYLIKKKSGGDLSIQIGDKVINTRNIYKDLCDKKGNAATCMNGEIGIVKDIQKEEAITVITISFIQNDQIVDIRFEPDQLEYMEYGYACTCHKLQGSGFSSVIVGMGSSFLGMYTREWFYTAVTRAKENVKIFATNTALKHAFDNCETNKKQTFLGAMLTDDKELVG